MPLIRLDGYYALVDLIGRRNLSTDAMRVLFRAEHWASTFGRAGAFPTERGDLALAGYGVLAFLYRLYILAVIALAVLPL